MSEKNTLITTKLLHRILTLSLGLSLCCLLSAKSFGQQANDSLRHTAKTIVTSTDSLFSDAKTDSIALPTDSTQAGNDSVSAVQPKKTRLDTRVDYSAKDSIVMFGDGTVFLYKEGDIKYNQQPKPIEVKADFIRLKMDSSTFYATGLPDSTGTIVGKPEFKDGDQEYSANFMSYNFNTKRGYIRGGVTQQGEGYIVADQTKKTEDDMMFMKGGSYSTCDNHDHPHFYLQLTKAKVKPGGFIAAGPAYLVIEDVPLPLAIPFGFFPFNQTYSSGVIMPSYGDEMTRGLFLKDGGYYFAINDYVDLALTGDIYTKGTWALRAASTYKVRYKFSGNVDISYRKDVTGIKGMSNYSEAPSFSINWRHTQDPKSSQYSSFSASVNYTSSGFNRNNVNNIYNPAVQSTNITSSSVNFSQRFPESPWSLQMNVGITQRTQDSTISLTLPNLSATMSRIYPFKRKNAIGKERFYEKIALSYTFTFENSINTKENKLLTSSFSRDWSNAIRHAIPISATFTALKYLNISPTINVNSRWYFNKIERSWDEQLQMEHRDTVSGFYPITDFNAGISLNTKLYGFYTPSKKIFGENIGQIRHVLTPSLSFSYAPDFSEPTWKYYSSYDKLIIDKANQTIVSHESVKYSPYSAGKYGVPGQGKTGSLSFSIANNVEMKVRDKAASDTSSTTIFKKISLIDNFTLGGGYNFAADSMNWQNFSASIRVKLTKSFSINLSGAFDPYMYGLNSSGTPIRINKLRWDNGGLPRFLGTSTSFNYTFNNDTFKKKDKKGKDQPGGDGAVDENLPNPDDPDSSLDPTKQQENVKPDAKEQKQQADAEGYAKPEFKWSLSLNYSVAWGQLSGTTNFDFDRMEYRRGISNHMVTLSGFINPTPKWKLNYTASVDLKTKKLNNVSLNLSRDLHCWTLSAMVTPIGYTKSFMITIGVNASLLRDLKYEKRSDTGTTVNWF